MTLLSTHGDGAGKTVADLLKQKFGTKLRKKDFKINRPQTLWGPDWSQLSKGRCPHCACKLYLIPSKPDFVRCKSRRHKKSFVISVSKINRT